MQRVPIQLLRSLQTRFKALNPDLFGKSALPSTEFGLEPKNRIKCQVIASQATKVIVPSIVPELNACHLGDSQDKNHVSQVYRILNYRGILKVNLKFTDNDCHYLRQLIQSLHQNHDHGLPINHSASRGWFWDVRPVQRTKEPAARNNKQFHQARSETMNNFPWHTDCSYEHSPPRFFALQVLHPDQCGGGILSILPVHRLYCRLSSSSQMALCAPEYRIQVPPEFIKSNGPRSILGPVLNTRPWPQLRFREDIFTPLTDRAKVAMEDLKSLLLGPHIQTEVLHLTPELLPRESIILLDNRRWLHARSEVKDPNRHLRRVRWDARSFN